MPVKPAPGQLWCWGSGMSAWHPSLEGKLFLILERFTHTNRFGDSMPAVRFVMEGACDWRHEDDVLSFAEMIG